MKNRIQLVGIIVLVLVFSACEDGINFFTLEQDIEFGEMVDSTILNTPGQFTVVSESEYAGAYTYLNDMMESILDADEIKHPYDFDWTIRIIDDTVLNAFAAPGGYLYFYTGLMNYLDEDTQLAGVMGHEIAHADRRHSTQTLTKVYGFSALVSILLGDDPSLFAEIVSKLALGAAQLKFSRNHEYEADEFSVRYNVSTKYHPKGVAGFFLKLTDEGNTTKIPEFLSTHPDPGNRIGEIDKLWKSLGEPGGQSSESEYNDFKALLP